MKREEKALMLVGLQRVLLHPDPTHATVFGMSGLQYRLYFDVNGWNCNCPHQPDNYGDKCSHALAVELAHRKAKAFQAEPSLVELLEQSIALAKGDIPEEEIAHAFRMR